MGPAYGAVKAELWELRNSLVHNAINVESFLSHTDVPAGPHLTKMGASGFVYVDTQIMCRDFESAFKRFRAELQQDRAKCKDVADRLKLKTEEPWDIASGGPAPSQALIEFVTVRK